MKDLLNKEYTLGELSRVLMEKGMADLFNFDLKRDIFGGAPIKLGAIGSMSDNLIEGELVDNIIFEIIEMAEADTEIVVKIIEIARI